MVLSVIIGVIFIIVFYVTKNSVFSGKGKAIFKGYVNMLASFLIALLGFAMLRFMNYEKKWERKLKAAHMRQQQVKHFQSAKCEDPTEHPVIIIIQDLSNPCAVILTEQVSTDNNPTSRMCTYLASFQARQHSGTCFLQRFGGHLNV